MTTRTPSKLPKGWLRSIPVCFKCGSGTLYREASDAHKYCRSCFDALPDRLTGNDVFGKSPSELIASAQSRYRGFPGVDGVQAKQKQPRLPKPQGRPSGKVVQKGLGLL